MPSIAHSVHRSRPGLRATAASLIAVLAISLIGIVPVVAVPVTPGPGYQDFVYKPLADGTGANDVTSFRNQSKLWFNDGRWWGILFDKGSTANGTYRIQSLNMPAQTWTSATSGAQVDNRNRSHPDALWDGTNLWVASSHVRGANVSPNGDLRVYKFSYNSAAKTYALVSGFPKVVAGGVAGNGTFAATIAKAPNGQLWVAYTQGTLVMAAHSTTGQGTIWDPPFAVPGQGNPVVTNNDQAAVVNLSNGIGVLWSNQTLGDEAFYFAGHKDGDADGTWGARETAFGGSGTLGADGHLSLKADGSGGIIAAVKTNVVTGTSALIVVLKRTGAANAAGSWAFHNVSSANQHGTRPVLVLDNENSQANVFITDTTTTSQVITRRTAPLSTLDFGAMSIGTPFISSTADPSVNNMTSTKQVTTASMGVVALGENIPTRRYLHGCTGGPCPVVPVADFSGTPTSGAGPLSVQFTDATTGTPATWAWTFGDGATSTLQNPSHTYNPGDYSVSLTVTNAAGTDSVTKTNYIHVTVPPGATYFALATPTRVLDTRIGNGLSGVFHANTGRDFQVTNGGTIPNNAVAVTGNLTVTQQTKGGYIILAPAGGSTTSTINFPAGDNRANGVTVALSGSGQLNAVYKASAGATAHLLFDVTGYFVAGTSGASYFPLAPTRVLDTRIGTGLSGVFHANTARNFQVTNGGSIPSDATAVTGNLTVTQQTKGGYIILAPAAGTTTSTINFPAGDNRANGVTVALSGSGQLNAVYKASAATTHLLFDVTGYFK
jgi:PKD repeat protein